MAFSRFTAKEEDYSKIPSITVDLLEDDCNYYIYAEFPGRDRSDIKVRFQGTNLHLKVEENDLCLENDAYYLIAERYHEEKERLIELSEPIVKEETSASFKNGLLLVTIKKVNPDMIDDCDLITIN